MSGFLCVSSQTNDKYIIKFPFIYVADDYHEFGNLKYTLSEILGKKIEYFEIPFELCERYEAIFFPVDDIVETEVMIYNFIQEFKNKELSHDLNDEDRKEVLTYWDRLQFHLKDHFLRNYKIKDKKPKKSEKTNNIKKLRWIVHDDWAGANLEKDGPYVIEIEKVKEDIWILKNIESTSHFGLNFYKLFENDIGKNPRFGRFINNISFKSIDDAKEVCQEYFERMINSYMEDAE